LGREEHRQGRGQKDQERFSCLHGEKRGNKKEAEKVSHNLVELQALSCCLTSGTARLRRK
jgi:hypothetical protein